MADGAPKDYSAIFDENAGHTCDSGIMLGTSNKISFNHPLPSVVQPPINNNLISSSNTNSGNISSSRSSHFNIQNKPLPPPLPTTRLRSSHATIKGEHIQKPPLDGMAIREVNRESAIKNFYSIQNGRPTIDLDQLSAKLQVLSAEKIANKALNEHYSSYTERKKHDKLERANYKVYIQYSDDHTTFVVRVDRPTLKAVKDKLPKRGNYRYFFRINDKTSEEFEYDGATVPFHEKDNQKQIYCKLFPAEY